MKEFWDEIWDQTQEYKTSGWNGIIEDWFTESFKAVDRVDPVMRAFRRTGREGWSQDQERRDNRIKHNQLLEEYGVWCMERDRVHQVLLDWEAEQWTTVTHTSLGGKQQTIRIRKT